MAIHSTCPRAKGGVGELLSTTHAMVPNEMSRLFLPSLPRLALCCAEESRHLVVVAAHHEIDSIVPDEIDETMLLGYAS
jgi:hypothetical protein